MINYYDLFFKTGNSVVKSFDFLKRFVTLHDLLIDLFYLIRKINTLEAAKEQNDMIKKINEIENFVLLKEKSIKKKNTGSAMKKVKNRRERNQTLAAQKSVLKNVIRLYDKRTFIINAFVRYFTWEIRSKIICQF